MILQELCQLCERKGLLEESGYERKEVDFIIQIDSNGSFVNLVATQDERGRGIPRKIPALPKRSSGVNPGFFVDNSKYVLGIGMDPKEFADEGKREKRARRNASCCDAFRALVGSANDARDDMVLSVVEFYNHIDENLAAVLKLRPESEWNGSEILAFSVGGVADFAHDSAGARRAWAMHRDENKASAKQIKCILTGTSGSLARLHPPIKRVPAGQSSGTTLVSFNASAFESHNAKKGENAPISAKAAEQYGRALNWLLEGTPVRRFRQGVRLGDEAVTLLWTREEAPELQDVFSLFDPSATEEGKPTAEQGMKTFDAAWRGIQPSAFDDTELFALTLGGNAARLVIRDWFTNTLGATKTAVRRYFDDLALDGEVEPMPIPKLLGVLDPPGKAKLEPALAGKIFHCALTGKPFPRTMLTHALLRFRTGDKHWENRTRISIIKAFLRRQEGRDIQMALDKENKDAAYLLGRLFAVLQKLQEDAAGGGLNRSIRDTHYSSASTTPAAVFGKLLGLSMHHVSKLGGKAIRLETFKGEIIESLEAAPFPKTLSPEQQGMFAVGYYHQQKHIFTKAAEKREE